MAELGGNPNPISLSPAPPNSKQPRGGDGGKGPQRSATRGPQPLTPVWRRRWGPKTETGNHKRGGGAGVEERKLYPSGKHRGGEARDRHAPPTNVVSRSSSSQGPFPSPIYATLRKRSRKTPFQEARETTRHHLNGVFGTWASSSGSD